jgi:hypothetical protein
MKTFAKLSANNEVLNIVAVNDEIAVSEAAGIAHLQTHNNWPTWKQVTSDRGSAGKGFTYSVDEDLFYPPQPYPSWTRSGKTWNAPVAYPTVAPENLDSEAYYWDEDTLSWIRK